MIIKPEVVIDHYINRLNSSKYEVMFRTESGIQVKRLKRVNRLGIWTGLLLLPFWGIGFIIWLLVLIDYWLQHEKITFITVDQMVKHFKGVK